MALSSIAVDAQSGLEFNVSAAVTGVSGGLIRFSSYAEPSWLKSALATNNVTAVAYASFSALAAGANQDYDLTAMTDPVGVAVNFASVKFVFVRLTSATGKLRVGGGANPHGLWFSAVTERADIEQGGPPFFHGSATAKAVSGAAKTVRINNTHGSETASGVIVVGGLI